MANHEEGYLGLAQETGFGVEAAAPAVYAPIRSESLSMENNLIIPVRVNGTRHAGRALPGRVTSGGGISVDLAPSGAVPWMLKGLLGSVESTDAGDGVYEHVFTPSVSAVLPSFTVQVGNGAMAENWLGCTFGQGTISVSTDDLLMLGTTLLAKHPKAATAAATRQYDSVSGWAGYHAGFTLNDVPNLMFEDFELTISNKLEQVWTLNGTRYCTCHVSGGFSVEGTISLAFSSQEEMKRMWGAVDAGAPQGSVAPGSLGIAITHTEVISGTAPYAMEIEMGEIFYKSAPAVIARGGDRIRQTVTFAAYCGEGSDFSIRLRNGTSGYPDPV